MSKKSILNVLLIFIFFENTQSVPTKTKIHIINLTKDEVIILDEKSFQHSNLIKIFSRSKTPETEKLKSINSCSAFNKKTKILENTSFLETTEFEFNKISQLKNGLCSDSSIEDLLNFKQSSDFNLLKTDFFELSETFDKQPPKYFQFPQKHPPITDISVSLETFIDEMIFQDFTTDHNYVDIMLLTLKETEGLFFKQYRILMNDLLRKDINNVQFIRKINKIEWKKIESPGHDFVTCRLIFTVKNFVEGYLFVFKDFLRNEVFFVYQKIERLNAASNKKIILTQLERQFKEDFGDVKDLDETQLSFECFPVDEKEQLDAYNSHIFLITYKNQKSVYNIRIQRGFEVTKIEFAESYYDFSKYNEFYYLHFRGLKTNKNLIDIFIQKNPRKFKRTKMIEFYFYTNAIKNVLRMIDMNLNRKDYVLVRVITYHPYHDFLSPSLELLLTDFKYQNAVSRFVDYFDLKDFHILLFQNENKLMVYKVNKNQSTRSVQATYVFECGEKFRFIACYEINQLLVICGRAIYVFPFFFDAFKIKENRKNSEILFGDFTSIQTFNYPLIQNFENSKVRVVENLIIQKFSQFNYLNYFTYKFLEINNLNFYKKVVICKDYLMAGNFLGFSVRILTENGAYIHSYDNLVVQKVVTYNFEEIEQMYVFSFMKIVNGDQRFSIANSKLNMLIQSKDQVLYLYEGLKKYTNGESVKAIKLSNLKRLLQCNMGIKFIYEDTIAISCLGVDTDAIYYKFDKSTKSFIEITEFKNCQILNRFASLSLITCIRSKNEITVYSNDLNRLRNVGVIDLLDNKKMVFYQPRFISDYLFRFDMNESKHSNYLIEILKVVVNHNNSVELHHFLTKTLILEQEDTCQVIFEDNLILLLCELQICVYYVDFNERKVHFMKKTLLKESEYQLDVKSNTKIQLYYYSNSFFQKVLSGSQSDDLIIAFPGCCNEECGIISYNTRSTQISSFVDFQFIYKKTKEEPPKFLFSESDFFINQSLFTGKALFSGFMITAQVTETSSSIFKYKTQIIFPFKHHYEFLFFKNAAVNSLMMELSIYKLYDKNPANRKIHILSISNKKERRLETELGFNLNWIARSKRENELYYFFDVEFDEVVTKPVLRVEFFVDFMTDNFVKVVAMNNRIQKTGFLSFERDLLVSKKIINPFQIFGWFSKTPKMTTHNSNITSSLAFMVNQKIAYKFASINLIANLNYYYIIMNTHILKYQNRKLVKTYPLNKYLYLPVSFIRVIKDLECVYKMLKKTSIVLVLCRLKNSGQSFKLFNVKSLDGSFESSPDFLNFFEVIRRSDYDNIEVKNNFVTLVNQKIEQKLNPKNVMYPFIMLGHNQNRHFLIKEAIVTSDNNIYAKVHWVRINAVWKSLTVELSENVDRHSLNIRFQVSVGEQAEQTLETSIKDPFFYFHIKTNAKRFFVTQLHDGFLYLIFSINKQYIGVIAYSLNSLLHNKFELNNKNKMNKNEKKQNKKKYNKKLKKQNKSENSDNSKSKKNVANNEKSNHEIKKEDELNSDNKIKPKSILFADNSNKDNSNKQNEHGSAGRAWQQLDDFESNKNGINSQKLETKYGKFMNEIRTKNKPKMKSNIVDNMNNGIGNKKRIEVQKAKDDVAKNEKNQNPVDLSQNNNYDEDYHSYYGFWKTDIKNRRKNSFKIKILASKNGLLVYLVRNQSHDEINIIRFLSSQSTDPRNQPNISNFRDRDKIKKDAHSEGSIMKAIKSIAKKSYVKITYQKNSILNAMFITSKKTKKNNKKHKTEKTKTGKSVLLVLKNDGIEKIKVFENQTLKIQKKFFKSKKIVFKIYTKNHILNYNLSLKKLKDYFEIPQVQSVYDEYYLMSLMLSIVIFGFGFPIFKKYFRYDIFENSMLSLKDI